MIAVPRTRNSTLTLPCKSPVTYVPGRPTHYIWYTILVSKEGANVALYACCIEIAIFQLLPRLSAKITSFLKMRASYYQPQSSARTKGDIAHGDNFWGAFVGNCRGWFTHRNLFLWSLPFIGYGEDPHGSKLWTLNFIVAAQCSSVISLKNECY